MASERRVLFSENEWIGVTRGLSLSPQQDALARNLLSGKSDKQIAREMGIAVPTVRSHITRLFRKFDVCDRIELILLLVACLQASHESRPMSTDYPLLAEVSTAGAV
ncbi:MAG: helix-turn-helix transcriptional regulator [Sedimentisphaerales bacterium]|nr:helix-turn-helix transcriptional regulator [Sedimentisphaerales bacterium]